MCGLLWLGFKKNFRLNHNYIPLKLNSFNYVKNKSEHEKHIPFSPWAENDV